MPFLVCKKGWRLASRDRSWVTKYSTVFPFSNTNFLSGRLVFVILKHSFNVFELWFQSVVGRWRSVQMSISVVSSRTKLFLRVWMILTALLLFQGICTLRLDLHISVINRTDIWRLENHLFSIVGSRTTCQRGWGLLCRLFPNPFHPTMSPLPRYATFIQRQ